MRTDPGASGSSRSSGAFHLKSRTGLPSAWVAPEASDAVVAVGPETPIDDAEFVALDVETNGSTPFWIIEIGAERFAMRGSLSLFDTLVECRAPINSFARRRHRIDRSMLEGAPSFHDARRAFLRFARGAPLVEHSHDAFDTYLIGRGLDPPLDHLIFDTSSLARLILDLPTGQTPGLAKVVEALGVSVSPVHAALSDAQATAAVFRELVRLGRERYGWERLGDLLAVQERKVVDRSAIQLPRRRRGSGRGNGRAAGQG
jgi:DNA polymerase III alpha subunit (gram-positive type)